MDCTLCGKPMKAATSTGRVRLPIWACAPCGVVLERKIRVLQGALTTDGNIRFEAARTLGSRRRDNPEHRMQVALFEKIKEHEEAYPLLQLVFAVPNGGFRHKSVAVEMEAEGVRAGVPDIEIPVARHGFRADYIEMKVQGNSPTRNQKRWHAMLLAEGARVTVQRSILAAWREICWYLELPEDLLEH